MNLDGKLYVNLFAYDASAGSLKRVGVIDNIISLTAEMKFGDTGTATLTVPYSKSTLELLEESDIFNVSCIQEQKTAYLIKTIERSYKASGNTIKVSAEELKALTARRVELSSPTYIEEDVTAAIEKIINDNILVPSDTTRKIEGAWLSGAPAITAEFTAPEKFAICSASLRTICSEANCDYSAFVYISSDNTPSICWTITNPTDRTYSQKLNTQFMLTLDNDFLSEATVTYDKHNLPSKMIVSYNDGTATSYTGRAATGFNLYESFVNAGNDASTETEAQSKGEEAFEQYSDETTITLKASHTLMKKLFVDYNLGDIGTFILDSLQKDVQLTTIRFTFENGSVQGTYTFGYEKNTITDALRRLTQSSRNKK